MLTVSSRIVVPFDGSELSKKALETAIILAKQDERVELDVLMVVDIPTSAYYSAASSSTNQIDSLREAYLNTAKELLTEVEQELKAISNKTRTLVIEGIPSKTIINFINDNNADLVVMGSRGLSGIKEMFLGSVSHYVVQKSTCPVFIVK